MTPLPTQAETSRELKRNFDKGGLPFSSQPALISFSALSNDRVRRRPSGVSTLARLAAGLEEEEEEEEFDDALDDEVPFEKLTLRSRLSSLSFFFFFFFSFSTTTGATTGSESESESESLLEEEEELPLSEEEELEEDSIFFLFLDIF